MTIAALLLYNLLNTAHPVKPKVLYLNTALDSRLSSFDTTDKVG